MSTELKTKKVWECKCEIPSCPSKGEPWESKDFIIPKRCPTCGSYRWNGQDKRRKKPAEAEE